MLPILAVFIILPQDKVSLTLAADTVIDRQAPDANAGREPILKVGDGRAILIRFPELGVRYGAGKRVKSARLTFRLAGSTAPAFVGAERLLRPWGEGGVFVQSQDSASSAAAMGDATWTSAMKGLRNWERPGARGEGDYEILPEVKSENVSGAIALTGLERAVQSFVDAPWLNYGLRIEFRGDASLMSADAFSNGPVLDVEFGERDEKSEVDLAVVMLTPTEPIDRAAKPGTPVRYEVAFRNLGSKPSSSAKILVAIDGDKPLEFTVDPPMTSESGGGAQFTAQWPGTGRLPSYSRIAVWVKSSDKDDNPSNNGLVYYPLGVSFNERGGGVGRSAVACRTTERMGLSVQQVRRRSSRMCRAGQL